MAEILLVAFFVIMLVRTEIVIHEVIRRRIHHGNSSGRNETLPMRPPHCGRKVTEERRAASPARAADEEERKRADEELAKIQADADAAERARGGLQQQLTSSTTATYGSETGGLSALCRSKRGKSETGDTARPVAWRS